MVFPSWRKLVGQVQRNRGKAQRGKGTRQDARKSPWLWLEQLEDRTLMSVFQWTGSGATSSWSDVGNWAQNGVAATSFPNAVGDVAQFLGPISGNTTVGLNAPITVGEVDFATSSSITINTSNNSVLTFSKGSGSNAVLATLPGNTGTDSIFAPITVGAGASFAANLTAGTLLLNNSGVPQNKIPSTNSFNVNGGILNVQSPNNTDAAAVVVNTGTLLVNGNGTLGNTSTLAVATRGTITIDDSLPGSSNSNRVGDNTAILLNGGIFSYIGANNAASTETVGPITVNKGSSTILTTTTGSTGSVVLTAASLARNAGATVTFQGNAGGQPGVQNLDTAANHIVFTTVPTLGGNGGGILPYAMVINNDFGEFATYDSINNSIAAFTNYVTSIGAAGPLDIVKEASAETLTANKTIYALLLTGAGAVGEAGNTFTIASGGIINTATSGGTISGGTLSFGTTGEGIIQNATVGGITANFINLGYSPTAGTPQGAATTNYQATPIASRIDPSLNYPENAIGLQGAGGPGNPQAALPAGVQANNVAAVWTGTLNILSGGNYTFAALVYDGMYLFIDGNEVTNQSETGGQVNTIGPSSLAIALTPGLHAIQIDYDHNVPQGTFVLSYAGPDTGLGYVTMSAEPSPGKPGLTTTATLTINSTIAGSGGLTAGGNGGLILANPNTYSGQTTLAGGTMTVASSNALGTGPLSLVSGTLLASTAVTLPNALTLTDAQATIGGNNNITFAAGGTLTDTGILSNTLTVSNQGQTTIAGVLSGTGSLTIAGGGFGGSAPYLGFLPKTGNLILSGANTYSGGTNLINNASVIVAASTSGTTSGPFGTGTLTLTSGTLLSDASARTLSNPVSLAGNATLSGSSYGGTSVSSSSFNFTGSVNVATASTLTVQGGSSASPEATISGNLTGASQLTVAGIGYLALSGTNSAFTGGLALNAGSLGAFGTLIVGSSGALGTGTLTLSAGALQAGSSGITIANPLIFTAGSYVAFTGTNPLTFANAASATNVLAGPVNLIVNTPTTFNEVLADNSGSMTVGSLNLFSGASPLTFTGADTYSGTTVVNGSTLVLTGAAGALTGTNQVAVNAGATLSLLNATGANNNARLPSSAIVSLNGGTFSLTGGPGTQSTQSVGGITAASGNSVVLTTAGTGSGSSVSLAGGTLAVTSGATINFQAGPGQTIGSATNQVLFTSVPSQGNVIQGATVTDSTSFSGNTSGYNLAISGASGVAALTTYASLSASGANQPTDNVLVTASTALTASDQVSAVLLLGSGINLSGSAGTTLTVSGGIVASNAATATGANTISVPTLTFGTTTGNVFTNNGTLTISSNIAGTGGLTISGPGTLTLPSANSYTNTSAPAASQALTVTGTPTGGTFILAFNGAATVAINPLTLTPAILQTDLQSLGTIGQGNALVTGSAPTFTVQFTGLLAGATQPALVLQTNSLTGGTSPTVQITVQSIGSSTTFLDGPGTLNLGTNGAIQGGLTVTNGTIQSTAAVTLANGVSFGAGVATGIGGVPASGVLTIGGTNPVVIGGNVTLNGLTTQITVSGSAPLLIAATIGQAGGSTALIKQGTGTLTLSGANTYQGVTLVQQGIVNIQNNTALGATGNAAFALTFDSSVTNGTFTLSFNGATTNPITWSTSSTQLALNIQTALDVLSTVGLNNAAAAATSDDAATVTFQNQLGASILPPLLVNSSNLGGGGVTIVQTTAGTPSGTVVSAGATLALQGGLTNVGEYLTVGGTGASGVGAAIYNAAGNNSLTSAITMSSNTTFGGDVGIFQLGGNITGSADLTKVGGGNLVISPLSVAGTSITDSNSTFTGETNINLGVLQINDPTGLGSNAGGTVVANGAQLTLGRVPTISNIAGYGLSTSHAGIIAGEALTLSGTGVGLAVSNLVAPSGALQANSETSVTWTGTITLAGDTTISNADALQSGNAQTGGAQILPGAQFFITGPITGTGNLTTVGGGSIMFEAANTYTGATTVAVGTLDFAGSGSLNSSAGVNAVQTITLGGTVTGGSFTLAFNGITSAAIQWNSSGTVLASNIQSALNALTSIGTGNAAVTGTGPFTVTFQSVLGKTNVPLMTAASSLTGTGPTLSLASSTTGVSSITVRVGASLTIDNTLVNLSNRLGTSTTVALNGGTFTYFGTNAVGATSTEKLGAITLGSGYSTILSQSGSGANAAVAVTSAGLFRTMGATVDFQAGVTPLGSSTNQLLFTSAPTLVGASGTSNDSIMPYAVVQSPGSTLVDFATYAAGFGVEPYSNYVTSLASAGPNSNVKLTTGSTLSSNIKVNSLLLLGTLTLGAGAGGSNFTISIGSGALGATGGGTGTIAGGTLDFGSTEGIVTATSSLTIGSAITGSGGLTISGPGTVTLNGTGVYTGVTTYNGAGIPTNSTTEVTGNLALGNVSALGNTTLDITAGVFGPTYGGNFSVFANPIVLNNSVVGFGITGARPTFAGPITLFGSNTINAPNITCYIGGAISGPGSLNIGDFASSGFVTAISLEGNNSYTGGTNIAISASSEVVVTNSNAFGTGPINWLQGAIDTTRSLAQPTVEAAVGSVTINNPINLANSSVYAYGPPTAAGSGVVLSGPISVIGSNIIGAGLTLNGTAGQQNLTLSGVISGPGNVTFEPGTSSTITVSGANTFTGGSVLTQVGTLILGNSAALGTGPYDQQEGTLQDDGIHALTIANPVFIDNLTNSLGRTISATSSALPLTFTGMVSSTPALSASTVGGFIKGGLGNVVFQSPINLNNTVVVNQGPMTLNQGGSLFASGLTINPGASLVLDNSVVNNVNRIADGMGITLGGGTLDFRGNNAAGALSTETVGAITLNPGGSTISSTAGSGAGATAILSIFSVTRNAGAILNFVGSGPSLGAATLGSATNQIIVTSAMSPAPQQVTNGNLVPYATVTTVVTGTTTSSFNFASAPPSAPFNIAPFTAYTTAGLSSAGPQDVVKVTASDPLASGGNVAAVLISGDNINIGSGGGTLTVGTGMIAATGGNTAGDTISGPVTFSGEGILVSNASPGLTVGGVITAASGLTTGGTGTITLSAGNAPGGTATLTGGTVVVNNGEALGASNGITVLAGAIQGGPIGGLAGITLSNAITLSTGPGGLTFSGANPLTLSGTISGTGGSIIVNSTSSLTLAGTTANTYTGTTTVSAGILLLAKTPATGTALAAFAGPVLLSGGVLQENTNFNQLNTQNVTISATNAVQTINFAGNPTGGTFTLGINSQTTSPISYTSVASTLQSNIQGALNSLISLGAGSTLVLVNGNSATVQFIGPFAGLPQQTMTTSNNLAGGTSPAVSVAVTAVGASGTLSLAGNIGTVNALTFINGGVATMTTGTLTLNSNVVTQSTNGAPSTAFINGGNLVLSQSNQNFITGISGNVQSITLPGSPTGGTFTLTFNGQTTNPPIPFSSVASTLASSIQSALSLLPNIGAGNVAVSATSATSFAVTFQNALAGATQTLLTANSLLTGGSSSTVAIGSGTVEASPVQTIKVGLTSGTFTLTFAGLTTSAITYSSVASTLANNIQSALNTLSAIGAGGTSVSVTGTVATVTFNTVPGVVVPLIGSASSSLTTAVQTPGFGGDLIISSGIGGGTNGLAKIGVGTLTFTGTTGNSYSGTSNVVDGTLILAKQQAVAALSGSLEISDFNRLVTVKVLSGFAQLNTQNTYVNAFGTLDMSAATATNQTIGSLDIKGGTILTGSNTLVLGGDVTGVAIGTTSGNLIGKLDLGTTSRNFFVLDNGSTPGLNLVAVISSAQGAYGINKQGAGTLDLDGTASNTFTGPTNVNEGTLLLNVPNVILTDSTGSTTGGSFVLTFNGANPQTVSYTSNVATLQSNIQTAVNTLVGAGNALVSAASASSITITYQAAFASGFLPLLAVASSSLSSGTMSSAVPLMIPGPGALTVGDSVGGSGVNKVDVLRSTRSNQIASTVSVTVNNSGLLDLDSTNNTIAGLTIAGGTVNTETGTLTLAGNVSGTASAANLTPATINGNLNLGSTTRLFDVQQGNVLTNGVLQNDMVINALISGSGGLTKVSPGTLQLTATNAYTGPTTVNLGPLVVDGSLPNSVQTIGITGAPTGGTFTLTFSGSTSAAISYSSITSVLQSNIQTALNNLATIGAGNSFVSATSNASIAVVFTGTLAAVPQNTIGVGTSGLTGGTTPAVAVTAVAATPVAVAGGVLGGTGTTGGVAATAGGVVNPGDPVSSTGTFAITSPTGTTTLDLSGGGNLTVEIAKVGTGTVPGTNYDQLKLTGAGTLKLGGTSSLTVDLAGVQTDGTANGVVLFTNLVGAFSSVNTINNPLGLTPVLTYLGTQLNIGLAAPATHFAITAASSSPTAGTAFNLTVTALDQFNQPALTYTGTVHFSKTDSGAASSLPSDYTFTTGTGASFDNGIHVFTGVKLVTVGSQTITATDTTTGALTSGITGNGAFTVVAAAAQNFGVTAPTSVAAGQFVVFTVTARDQFNNPVSAYAGTVQFTSSDSQAGLANSSTLTNGVGFFAASLRTAGPQTITATDAVNSIAGTSGTITVTGGAVSHFGIIAPASATPGSAFTITVQAEDQLNNVAPGYTGTVHFTSSDSGASLPADATLVNGVGNFSVTLKAPGIQTITATDKAVGTISGNATVNLSATGVKTFVFSVPTGATAGHSFVFTVSAKDASNNTVAGYSGTVHFSSSDGQADLPTDATLTNGTGLFAAVLRTAGPQTLTATDVASSAISGPSGSISVSGLPTGRLTISANTSEITGVPFAVTVKAQDQFGNTNANYTGTVHLTSSDAAAVLPSNATLINGMGTFNVTLKTPGTQTVSGNDTVSTSIVGTSNNLATLGLAVTSITPTPSGFVATFNKPFDPSQINLYDNSGANGPDDVLLTGPGASQTSTHGSLIIDPSNQTITFVKTSTFTTNVNSFNPQTGVLTAGTYTVTFRSAANGFVDSLGAPLDGTSSGNPAGSNYTTTFVVASTPAEIVGIPGFARGPNSAATINLPNNLTFGIPVNLSTGAGVTAGKFTLQYNSALLSITGVTVNSVLTGATLTYDPASTAGSAVIDFSSPTPLAAGPVRLGGLVATVPNSAAPLYTQKALLHWSSASINSGATAAVGGDSVDINAYFGDATGDGTLSGGDASQISQVATGVNNNPATGTIGGFSAFRLADPVLIGDLTASGTVGAGAVTLMNSFLSGTPRAQIPSLPTGLTIPANGVDPALSIPTNLQATAGSTVVVPVQIDSGRPEGSTGVTEAILAVQYDPAEFTVSAQDVELGNLPLSGSGWQLQTAINSQTGQIGIDVFGTMPLQTPAGGTLVTISFHVRENAGAGSTGINLVPSVNPTGSRSFVTTVSDAQGAMVLHPAETTLGLMPGAPGSVAVASDQWAVGSGQWAVRSGQVAVSNEQAAVNSNESSDSALATVHSSLSTALVEQVFGELQPMMVSQETTLAQPGAILGSSTEEQASTSLSDTTLQKLGVAQHDWAPADLVAYLGQAAKAGRRSPLDDFLDGGVSEQDAADLAGVDEFFAREAANRG